MADGPSIQAAGLRALKAGMTLKKVLGLVRAFREQDEATPLILMGYYSPVYVYGVDRFLADAKSAGVDGLIIVDLPPEEDAELCLPAIAAGLNFIRLATPTTDEQPSARSSREYVRFRLLCLDHRHYRCGNTRFLARRRCGARIKRHTKLPVAVGFGVKNAATAEAIARQADGVVVGTALIDALKGSLDPENRATARTVSAVADLVSDIAGGVRAAHRVAAE